MTKLLLVFACCLVAVVRCDVVDMEGGVEEEDLSARRAWMDAEKSLKSVTQKVMRKAMPSVMKEVYKKDLTTPCLTALLQFSAALRQSKAWPFKMLDSSGRFPEGFLSGTLTSLGNYQECVRIRLNETRVRLQGQYCMVQLTPPMPPFKPFTSMHGAVPQLQNISAPDSVITYMMTLVHNLHVTTVKVGICTPSTCTTEDVDKLIKIVPEKLGLNWKFDVLHCETQEPVHFTQPQVFVLCVLGGVVVACLLGTLLDVFYSSEHMEKKSIKATLFHVCRSFSLAANARKLSSFGGHEHEQLNFVHGLVFFLLYWVSISNTFMYVNYDVTSNFVRAFELVQQLFYEVVLNRVMALQVLFFISGLVTTYKWLKSPEEKLNVFKFLLKRYIRFTPTYALVLGVILMSPTWGSGPSWNLHMDPVYTNCRDHWWYNLLYINNYMDSEKVCLDHTWVFAVDAQLHVIAIFILVPLKMRPKIGLLVLFVLSMASVLSVALTNVYFDLPPNEATAFLHPKDRMYYAEHSYYRVYSHLLLYCTGALVAYIVHLYPRMHISKVAKCALWLGSLCVLEGALLCVHVWREEGTLPSPPLNALYSVMSRVAEAAFLAWLAIACMTDNAGPLREFLCWRPFAFLSRLSFLAYLMHVPVITMVMNFKKSHIFVSDLEVFYVVLNHVAGTFLVSYLLYLFLEAPFHSLAEVVRRGHKGRTLHPAPAEKEKMARVTTKGWTDNKSHC